MMDLHTRALSSLSSIMLCGKHAAKFAHAFVQETLERLDSCHDGDFSRILLRMEYLDRIIINSGELPDPIVLEPP